MKLPDDEIGEATTAEGIAQVRLWVFRGGVLLLIVGVLMFFSTFVIFAVNFGNFENFEQRGRLMALMAVGGMFLMIAGIVSAAFAGSGVAGLLWRMDPREVRRRLSTWAKLSGQLTDEAFTEMKTVRQSLADLGDGDDLEKTEQIIQVRCRGCGALNDELSKYCGQCGQPL